ncbi:MAG TPA: hypothetical protein VND23_04000 [Acidimicrobiales bacterium]|nr:hypothetical protein [Acidimicrobiales bacterium]
MITVKTADPLLLSGIDERANFPGTDGHVKLLVPRIVERERRSRQAINPAQHLREHVRVEAAVLLGREIEQSVEPVAAGHSHEVDEVAGFSAPEEGEQLVDGELLARQQRKVAPRERGLTPRRSW